MISEMGDVNYDFAALEDEVKALEENTRSLMLWGELFMSGSVRIFI